MEISENLLPRVGVLFYLLLASLITSWFAWRLGFYQLPKTNQPSSSAVFYKNVMQIFILFLVVEIIVAPLLFVGWSSLKQGKMIDLHSLDLSFTTQAWMHLISIGLCLLVIGLYCLLANRSVVKAAWGQNAFTLDAIGNFLMGMATWVICYPIIAFFGQGISLLMMLFHQGPRIDQVAVKQLKTTLSNPALFWTTSFTIVFIVPVIEELLFRGFLQTWLKGVIGTLKAVLVTALIFAFFHFSISQGLDNIELVFSLFILGCFLGFIYERQRSLWASIGLHATFNAVSIWMILKTFSKS